MKNNKNDKNEHNHTEDGVCVNCYEEYLKEEGISNEGFWINPDYMTDEDEFVNIKVKKEISMTFRVRVHKDHIDHFSVVDYVNGYEIEDFWKDTDPYELIDSSFQYHGVVDTQKVSGDKVKDDFFHYVCFDGTFHPPFDETKSVDEEVVEIPKLLN